MHRADHQLDWIASDCSARLELRRACWAVPQHWLTISPASKLGMLFIPGMSWN